MRASDMRAPPAILSYSVPLLQPLSKQRPNRRSSSPASRGPCAQPPHPEDEAPHRPSVRLPRVHASPILICWRASSPPCTATIPQRSKRRLASAPPPAPWRPQSLHCHRVQPPPLEDGASYGPRAWPCPGALFARVLLHARFSSRAPTPWSISLTIACDRNISQVG
jgi:hypothetical protein